MPTQKKELTKGAKLRAILQEFKKVPWHGGLETLDYNHSLEELKTNANRIKNSLDNYNEFTVGDCVVKASEINKRGTVIHINADRIVSEIGDVVVLWDEENDTQKNRIGKIKGSNICETVNSGDLVYVFCHE